MAETERLSVIIRHFGTTIATRRRAGVCDVASPPVYVCIPASLLANFESRPVAEIIGPSSQGRTRIELWDTSAFMQRSFPVMASAISHAPHYNGAKTLRTRTRTANREINVGGRWLNMYSSFLTLSCANPSATRDTRLAPTWPKRPIRTHLSTLAIYIVCIPERH